METITWLDPTVHIDEELKKPFKKFLTTTVNVGEVVEDGNYIAVINSKNSLGKDKDFIVIPKCLIIKPRKYVV